MNRMKTMALLFAVLFGSLLSACQSRDVQAGSAAADATRAAADGTVFQPLPERAGPRTQTSGRVPHVQVGVEWSAAITDELRRRAFSLPGVENRPTVVSLGGARGMWLADGVQVVNPKAITGGREFAHIHIDGSLHAAMPLERVAEVIAKGWGERHPWADQRDGWGGLMMLFTPQSDAEIDVIFQLIVESYNHITGLALDPADY